MADTVTLDDTVVRTDDAGATRAAAPAKDLMALATPPRELKRTTVLPRVDWSGQTPVLRPPDRQRFEEVAALGEGGQGQVVLMKDHDIDRMVALKRLPASDDVGALVRFVDEIRTVGSLEHPNIMPLHDVGIDEHGRYFFVMKHLRGETLESLIEKLRAGDAATHERLPFHVRVQLFLSVLNGIAYAHREGFIHRDLKPANIMVGPYGEVTVMDWGLARRAGGPSSASPEEPHHPAGREGTPLQTQAGAIMGTPLYMSPEQARGDVDKLDVRSDVYSLCVLFHELLYLRHYLDDCPHVAAVLEGVQQRTPEMFDVKQSPHQPVVPAELGWYLLRGLDKDPAKRFASVSEMIAELQRIVDGRIRVNCQRTFAKRVLQELIHRTDEHPVAIIIGSTLVMSVLLAGLVTSVLKVMG